MPTLPASVADAGSVGDEEWHALTYTAYLYPNLYPAFATLIPLVRACQPIPLRCSFECFVERFTDALQRLGGVGVFGDECGMLGDLVGVSGVFQVESHAP